MWQVLGRFVPSFGRDPRARVVLRRLEGSDVVVGRRAVQHRGALVLSQPMARGMVNDWEDMERIWQQEQHRQEQRQQEQRQQEQRQQEQRQ